jgi:hypothetical protein
MLFFSLPTADVSLKGAHPIQNLGAQQTYMRRYLYMQLMEVVENDQVDNSPPIAEIDYKAECQKLKARLGDDRKNELVAELEASTGKKVANWGQVEWKQMYERMSAA